MDIKSVVSANLTTLKTVYELTNRQMATKCRVGEGTIARALNRQTALAVDTLADIAAAFGLEPWHLLIPNLDPKNPYVISGITSEEKAFYDRIAAAVKASQ